MPLALAPSLGELALALSPSSAQRLIVCLVLCPLELDGLVLMSAANDRPGLELSIACALPSFGGEIHLAGVLEEGLLPSAVL